MEAQSSSSSLPISNSPSITGGSSAVQLSDLRKPGDANPSLYEVHTQRIAAPSPETHPVFPPENPPGHVRKERPPLPYGAAGSRRSVLENSILLETIGTGRQALKPAPGRIAQEIDRATGIYQDRKVDSSSTVLPEWSIRTARRALRPLAGLAQDSHSYVDTVEQHFRVEPPSADTVQFYVVNQDHPGLGRHVNRDELLHILGRRRGRVPEIARSIDGGEDDEQRGEVSSISDRELAENNLLDQILEEDDLIGRQESSSSFASGSGVSSGKHLPNRAEAADEGLSKLDESNETPAPNDEGFTLQNWGLFVGQGGSACVNMRGNIEDVNMKKLNVWPIKLRHHDVVFKGQPPPKEFLDAVIKARADYLAAPLAA